MNNLGYKITDFFFINAVGLLMLKEIYAEREKDLKHDTIIRINLNNHRVLFEQISKKCLAGYFVEDIVNDENGLVSVDAISEFGIPFETKDTIKHIDLTTNGFKFKIYDASDNDKEYKINLSFDELNKASSLLESKQGEIFIQKVAEVKELAKSISNGRLFELDDKFKSPFTSIHLVGFNDEAIYFRTFKQTVTLPYNNMLLITLYQFRDYLKDVKG